MSSDSSDEENIGLLREAVDSQFFNDSMFEKKNTDKNGESLREHKQLSVELPPSLRRAQDEDEQFNLFRVTPEFRSHVAKHLSKALDEKLKKLLKSVKDIDNIPKKCPKSGVRLFSNSQKFLNVDKCISANNIQSIDSVKTCVVSKYCSKPLEKVDKALLKTIAVKPEDILSKKDTKFWSNRSKAPVFYYKKSRNDILVLTEPSSKC